MKVCTRCNKEKEFSEFYKNKDRLHSWCKTCVLGKRSIISNFKASRLSGDIDKNIKLVKRKKEEFARVKVGNIIKGLKVIFKSNNFMVLIDPKAPYRKVTYTINDFITNTN